MLIDETGAAFLSDFGLARLDSERFASVASTLDRGYTRWQAPEVLFPPSISTSDVSSSANSTSDSVHDPSASSSPCQRPWAADIWSFGMCILELFTHKQPFADLAFDAAVFVLLGSGALPQFPTYETWPIRCKEHKMASALARRCWSMEASERPTALDVVATLREYLASEDHDRQFHAICLIPGYARVRFIVVYITPVTMSLTNRVYLFRILSSLKLI